MLRTKGLSAASNLILAQLKEFQPAIVVIDSFKVFDDLATSKEELRKFGYEVAINLMAWEATGLLLGEYAPIDYQTNPFFSIVDGIVLLSQREAFGEEQRFFKIVKMRGTDHSRQEHPFLIGRDGVELFASETTIRREHESGARERCTTHIPRLDELLGAGIPCGSSLLIGGVAGTGKTVLSLEFIYRGALAGEKGILFSFEETEERLLAAAQGLGWDLAQQIERGMVEIVFIPQPDIMVEAHLLMMQRRIEAMKAKRVVIDSVSVFLHKVTSPQLSRVKIFHLCSLVQNAQAVGFFATDIPYGSTQVSRFGVEETVVDGVIILSSVEEGAAQLLASADSLGLQVRAMVDKGLIEILYISREHVRAGQFLTVLADRLTDLKASRLFEPQDRERDQQLTAQQICPRFPSIAIASSRSSPTSSATQSRPPLKKVESPSRSTPMETHCCFRFRIPAEGSARKMRSTSSSGTGEATRLSTKEAAWDWESPGASSMPMEAESGSTASSGGAPLSTSRFPAPTRTFPTGQPVLILLQRAPSDAHRLVLCPHPTFIGPPSARV